MLVLAFNFWESPTIQAQDSNQNATLRFSLITCDAGEDIYTIWGHTAIRVVDSMNQTDIVYNYGSFDFNTPYFIAWDCDFYILENLVFDINKLRTK